jgi:hypothetical protein
MWHKEYRDYETDQPLIKCQVYPEDGIIGCEMHDLNGWGNTIHKPLNLKTAVKDDKLTQFFES